MNVLLVDDDAISNFLSTKTLESIGGVNDIRTALNGKQAIDLFNECVLESKPLPDIVLLDLNMPIMDGFDFMEAFNQLHLSERDHVRIIVVSSSENPSDIEKAKQFGINQYLVKPLKEQSLRTALETQVASS